MKCPFYTAAIHIILFRPFCHWEKKTQTNLCEISHLAGAISIESYARRSARDLHVLGVPSQSASKKHNQEKRPTCLCAPCEFLPPPPNLSAMFDNHTILLLWLQNKQTVHMFSLRFALCSRDLDVLRVQRIIGFFVITHKSTRSENPIKWPQIRIIRRICLVIYFPDLLILTCWCHSTSVFNWSSLAQTHRQWTVPGRRTRDLPWQRTSVLSTISCQDWPADTFWCRWGPGEETFVIWSPETLNWKVTNKKAPKHRFRLYSGKETLGRVCLGLQWMVWVY